MPWACKSKRKCDRCGGWGVQVGMRYCAKCTSFVLRKLREQDEPEPRIPKRQPGGDAMYTGLSAFEGDG